jgi:hypothetical protein
VISAFRIYILTIQVKSHIFAYMEVHMELTKKTTILFPPELYNHLVSLAKQRRVSLGHLVRAAYELEYGKLSGEETIAAAKELAGLSLPVGSPAEMKQESVPKTEELLQ